MKIALVYFSATNNTAKIAEVIKKQLDQNNTTITEYNITDFEIRNNNIDFAEYDGVIFGFPIYAWRVPSIVRDWIGALDGKATKAGIFFTYGGVHVGAAHSDTIARLKKQNFKVLLSGEFLGKHTFSNTGWDILLDRPNKADFEVAEQFASSLIQKFTDDDSKELTPEPSIMSDRQLDKMENVLKIAVKPPSRKGKECSRCRTCEDLCPTKAMNAENGEADASLCIRCLRCLINCPENALEMDDLTKQQDFIKQSNQLSKGVLDAKKSKIIP